MSTQCISKSFEPKYLKAVCLRDEILTHMFELALSSTSSPKAAQLGCVVPNETKVAFRTLCKDLHCSPFITKPMTAQEIANAFNAYLAQAPEPIAAHRSGLMDKVSASRGTCLGTAITLTNAIDKIKKLNTPELIHFIKGMRQQRIAWQVRHVVLCEVRDRIPIEVIEAENEKLILNCSEAECAIYTYNGHCIFAQLTPPYRIVDMRLGVTEFKSKEVMVDFLRNLPHFTEQDKQ